MGWTFLNKNFQPVTKAPPPVSSLSNALVRNSFRISLFPPSQFALYNLDAREALLGLVLSNHPLESLEHCNFLQKNCTTFLEAAFCQRSNAKAVKASLAQTSCFALSPSGPTHLSTRGTQVLQHLRQLLATIVYIYTLQKKQVHELGKRNFG